MSPTRRALLKGLTAVLAGSALAGCTGRETNETPRSGVGPRGGSPRGHGGGGGEQTPYRTPMHSPNGSHGPSGAGNPGPMHPDGQHAPRWDDASDESTLGQWLSDVDTDTGVVDRTGEQTVTIGVGTTGNGGAFAYSPAAVRVSPGTRIVWEWTGGGGYHDVVDVENRFASELLADAGKTFSHTLDDAATYRYYCTPHRGLGMKGAVVVE